MSYNHQDIQVSNQYFRANHCRIYGTGNTVTGDHNQVYGNGNHVTGSHNHFYGSDSTVSGDFNNNRGAQSNRCLSGNFNNGFTISAPASPAVNHYPSASSPNTTIYFAPATFNAGTVFNTGSGSVVSTITEDGKKITTVVQPTASVVQPFTTMPVIPAVPKPVDTPVVKPAASQVPEPADPKNMTFEQKVAMLMSMPDCSKKMALFEKSQAKKLAAFKKSQQDEMQDAIMVLYDEYHADKEAREEAEVEEMRKKALARKAAKESQAQKEQAAKFADQASLIAAALKNQTKKTAKPRYSPENSDAEGDNKQSPTYKSAASSEVSDADDDDKEDNDDALIAK